MTTQEYGILVDYEWCTGCHTCETACQMEHGYEVGKFGIKLAQVGPFEYEKDKWQLAYIPIPTKLCDFCAERVEAGKLPTCMHHCQAKCLTVGPLDELQEQLTGKREQVLFHN